MMPNLGQAVSLISYSNIFVDVNIDVNVSILQVDELQNTIEEDQKSLVEEMRIANEELKHGMEDASGGSDAMAVDH
jgi:hypothetical protein